MLDEAQARLNSLLEKNFQSVAIELDGQDQYLYLKGYTAGLQEFVEALLFHRYISENSLCNWSSVNDRLSYEIEEDGKNIRSVQLLFPQVDFFLGMEDFTGELMRKCINSLGSGNLENCFKICDFVKEIYTGFLGEILKKTQIVNLE